MKISLGLCATSSKAHNAIVEPNTDLSLDISHDSGYAEFKMHGNIEIEETVLLVPVKELVAFSSAILAYCKKEHNPSKIIVNVDKLIDKLSIKDHFYESLKAIIVGEISKLMLGDNPENA